ncbi:GDSL-type esterase/lipase family protein [Lentisphaera profundi]|uniref:GDSL-type esterase/lipase family protein n=1 Tax=Lentisphaera profundi TaxID=1658616 RepID=A0ABY7W2Y8_9BACT|nr:GDSL-type esterase/lipase family protein [Lentisphaera profundi]WDE99339.1 GDSL-type esterase/lipase family protein [Lentisphaera profundi]
MTIKRISSSRLFILALLFLTPFLTMEAKSKKNVWKNFQRIDFKVDGRDAFIIKPKETAKGQPWIWRARFPTYHPEVDLILLEKGFHIAYINTDDMLGSPKALKHWDAFYKHMTEEKGFAEKVTLEAVSRGGLFAYRWASQNPEKVNCIYAEVPVCDFKSWPGGKANGVGNKKAWQNVLKQYQLNEQQALDYKQNPIDVLAPIAKEDIPLLHLISLNDQVVPAKENTFVLAKRYRQLGGSIEIIEVKIGPRAKGHHFDHPDPKRVADFIEKHSSLQVTTQLSTITPVPSRLKKFMPKRHNQKLAEAKERQIDFVMIGDSITHNWESEKNYAQIFKGTNMLNLGFAGDRTQNVLWRIQHGALDNIEPKLVTLMIGTNHLHNPKKDYTPDSSEDIFTGIQEIVKEIRTRLPKAKIIVFSIFPRRAPEYERVKSLNQLIPKIVDNQMVSHRDINHIFLADDTKINKALYSRDGLHLSSKGHETWAKELHILLKQ